MNTPAHPPSQALNALAHAEIGECLGMHAKQVAAYDQARTAATTHPTSTERWIAVAVGDSLPAAVMAYAIGACQRMQAGLLLLTVDALRVHQLLSEHLSALRGITCRTVALENASAAAVLRTLNRHSGLLFAVSGCADDPLRPFLRKRRALRTPVPIVLVSEKPSETAAPSRPPATARHERS